MNEAPNPKGGLPPCELLPREVPEATQTIKFVSAAGCIPELDCKIIAQDIAGYMSPCVRVHRGGYLLRVCNPSTLKAGQQVLDQCELQKSGSKNPKLGFGDSMEYRGSCQGNSELQLKFRCQPRRRESSHGSILLKRGHVTADMECILFLLCFDVFAEALFLWYLGWYE